MNKEKNYISSSYFGRAFYSEKNILCVLLSTKSPTTIGFYHQWKLISVVHTEPVLINHILVLRRRILSKDVVINLGKCIILRD